VSGKPDEADSKSAPLQKNRNIIEHQRLALTVVAVI